MGTDGTVPLRILGTGVTSPVGIGTAPTAAALRAGISRRGETRILDRRFEPIVMGTVPEDKLGPLIAKTPVGPPSPARLTRLVRLAGHALLESASGIDPMPRTLPLFLGLPERPKDSPPWDQEIVLDLLCQQTDLPIDLRESRLTSTGRAAGLEAICEAREWMQSNPERVAIAGGVDTYLDLVTLANLDQQERLLTPSRMEGFIPGEGAAFLLLRGEDEPSSGGPGSVVAGFGRGFEPGHIGAEEPHRAGGLSDAVGQALERLDGSIDPIRTVFAGYNGEGFWAKEWGVALSRSHDRFDETHAMHHPADCIGDPGAALGPLMLVIATVWLKSAKAPGPVLVWVGSDHGQRAAVVLH